MDNKKEKTFGDLFSSSTFGTDDDSQIFSQESKNIELIDNSEPEKKEVTFDNLFDQAISEQNEEEKNIEYNVLKKDDNTDIQEKTTEFFEPTVKEAEENSNPFFKEEQKTEEYPVETPNFFEAPVEEKVTEENSNPFFKEEQKTEESPVETPNFFEAPVEEKVTEEISNPFFEEEQKTEESPVETPNFFGTPVEKKVAEEISNPFFEEEQKTEESPVETPNFFGTPVEKKVAEENSNPFFEEEQKIEESPVDTPNFFETPVEEEKVAEESNILQTLNMSENSIIAEQERIDKIKNTPLEKENKNISPFFEDSSQSSDENPLFKNKINLMENQKTEQKIRNIDTTKSKHYNIKIVKKKEPLPKFIIGVLSYAIFIWLLLIGITLLIYVLDIKIRAAKGDYSSPTFNAYVVLTGSMLPDIQVYDVVVTKKVEAETLNEGDIITFASADSRFLGTIITHRILKKNYDAESKTYTFQTKGDNNNVADSALVPQNNIYGKVILKIPKLGYLQEFLASDGGWIIVILIPCLTVMSYDIVKLAKGLKKKKYKNIKVQK